jgi:transcriptional regulator with XRE-family HTH domain
MSVETGRLRVVAPESPQRAAEPSIDAPSPGGYLREQRLRRQMSLEQLAAATKIPRASIELLEDDRHEELPGPVFVKGFLRCCARALGVGTDAVMELLYERERAALHARRRERPVSGAHPAVSEDVVRRLPPRLTRTSAPVPIESPVQQLLTRLPSANIFLWLVVAVLVAMVVLAAFNLMGSAPAPGRQI